MPEERERARDIEGGREGGEREEARERERDWEGDGGEGERERLAARGGSER